MADQNKVSARLHVRFQDGYDGGRKLSSSGKRTDTEFVSVAGEAIQLDGGCLPKIECVWASGDELVVHKARILLYTEMMSFDKRPPVPPARATQYVLDIVLVQNGDANLGYWIRRTLEGFHVDADEDDALAVPPTFDSLSLLQAEQRLCLTKHVLTICTLQRRLFSSSLILVLLRRRRTDELQFFQPAILAHLRGRQESLRVPNVHFRPVVNLKLLFFVESLQVSRSGGAALTKSHEESVRVDAAGDSQGDAELLVYEIQEGLELGRWNKEVWLGAGLGWMVEIETAVVISR